MAGISRRFPLLSPSLSHSNERAANFPRGRKDGRRPKGFKLHPPVNIVSFGYEDISAIAFHPWQEARVCSKARGYFFDTDRFRHSTELRENSARLMKLWHRSQGRTACPRQIPAIRRRFLSTPCPDARRYGIEEEALVSRKGTDDSGLNGTNEKT